MRVRLPIYGLLALGLFTTVAAEGRPLTFTFDGTGSGTAGMSGFTNASFRIQLTAETAENYQYISNVGSVIVSTAYFPTTISIAGVGQGALTANRRIFCNQTLNGLGVTGPPEQDLLDIHAPVFAAYNLDQPFGPIFDPYPSQGAWMQFRNVGSALGELTFTDIRDVTFTVTPEPASLALLVTGAVVMLRRPRCGRP